MNIHYLRLTHTSGVTVDDLSTLNDDLDAQWAAHVQTDVSSDSAMRQIRTTFIPTSGTELVFQSNYSRVGAQGGGIKDSAASIVLNWVISSYYRGGHPRTYRAGVPSGYMLDGANIDSADLAALGSHANAWRNAINALTTTNITKVELGTVRYEAAGVWLSPPEFFPFTSVSARSKLGSQRRRITS